jgi:uncharacterized protein DUF2064
VTTRYVAVLSAGPPGQAPPGVDHEEFRLALLEDTYEVAAGMEHIVPALVLRPPVPSGAESIVWPGTEIVREETLGAAFAALHRLGAEQAALIAGDAPDLPSLLIGKLFRALEHAPAAVCPAAGGGLVALAAHLPAPPWLVASGVHLDTPDALAHLRTAAPRPGLVQRGPDWHRLRAPADLSLLDPGLEGWENTRALLEGNPLSTEGL